MQEGFSAGDANMPTLESLNFLENLRKLVSNSVKIGILGIAIVAAQIAPRGAYKNRGRPCRRGLALNTKKNLIDLEHLWAVHGLSTRTLSRSNELASSKGPMFFSMER